MIRPDASRRGSALVLVLWCLLVLGLAVFALVDLVDRGVTHATNSRALLAARAQAMSGIALAREPQVLPGDPILTRTGPDGEAFHAAVSSEGARINLNYVLLTKHREILVDLFTRWGVNAADAQRAVDCLYDWVTPGDLPSLHGAKSDDYAAAGLPQRPTHRPFQSLDEAASALGMDRVIAKNPRWQESLTVWSNGPLDLAAAPADLIAALFGVPVERARALTQFRNGGDGIAGTLDDATLSPSFCQANLSVAPAQFLALKDQFTFGSQVRRIVSTGKSGSFSTTITTVIEIDPMSPKLFVWSER